MVKGQRKRTYTDEFRQGAVALVLKEGRSVKQAAPDLRIPGNMLIAWVHQARRGHDARVLIALPAADGARKAASPPIRLVYNPSTGL